MDCAVHNHGFDDFFKTLHYVRCQSYRSKIIYDAMVIRGSTIQYGGDGNHYRCAEMRCGHIEN